MKARVLFVDDEPSILITFQAILAHHGFEVETASSGEEAMQKLQAEIFQVVITDLRMETPDAGRDVIRCAKAQQYKPIAVVQTAYPVPETEWRGWGADGLFEKPVSIEAMMTELQLLILCKNDARASESSGSGTITPNSITSTN